MGDGVLRIGGTLAAVVAALALGGGLAPAGAQVPPAATPDPAAVAAAIEQAGWYADAGASPGGDQLTALAASTAVDSHPIGFAVLAAEPAGSSQSFAYDVLDALPVGGRFETVVVLSPADVGVDSDYWDDGAIDAALDDALGSIRADPYAGLGALATALAEQPATTTPSDDGISNNGLLILVGLGVVALWVVSWLLRREHYERFGDGDEPTWDRRRRYQRYTGWSSRSSSFRSSSHRSSSGHSHRGSGGRRL